jgi:hypothetical protein
MAIKKIEEMTSPVSKREDLKMAMSAPDPQAEAYDFYRNMYEDMLERNQLPKNIKTFEDFMDEVDMLDITPNDFTKRKEQEGIMQLAGASGDNVIMSAIMWASTQPEFGSIDAVLESLREGSTTMNGLVNAYMDAKGDMS